MEMGERGETGEEGADGSRHQSEEVDSAGGAAGAAFQPQCLSVKRKIFRGRVFNAAVKAAGG